MAHRKIHRARFALAGLALLALIGWLAYRVALPAYVEGRVASELTALGFPDARFRVVSVSPTRMTIRELSLAPGLAIDELVASYRPTGLLRGRIDEVVLTGARLAIGPGQGSWNNLATRFVSRPRGGAGSSLPAIRIRDSMITVNHQGSLSLPIEADIHPQEDAITFEVRSRAGGLPLHVAGRHRRGAGPALQATARLGERVTPLAVTAELRANGESLSVSIQGRNLGADLELAGRRLTAPLTTVDGTLSLTGSSVTSADLTARVHGVSVDGVEAGDLTLSIDDRDGALAARLDVAGDWGAGWVRGQLAADPRTWTRGAIPIAWEAGGRLPEAGRRVLRDAGVIVGATTTMASSGSATLRLGDGAALTGGRMTFELAALAVPRWQLEASDLHATLNLSATLDRDRLTLEVADGSRLRAGRARRGAVIARTLSASGGGRLIREGDRLRLERVTPTRLRADRIVRRDLVIDDAALSIPIDRDRAQASVATVSWRGQALFGARGTVRLEGEEMVLEARCDTGDGAGGRLVGRAGSDGRGHLQLTVPATIVDIGSRAHTAARELAGLYVRGRIAGSLRLELGEHRRSRARLSLRDATVGRGDRRLEGVVSDVELTSLQPLRARISASAFDLAGGRVRVEPLEIDPEALDLGLDLQLRGLSAGRVLSVLSDGRAAATGRLDGTLALRIVGAEQPRVILGDGRLRARDAGRLRFRDSAAVDALLARSTDSEYGTVVRKRVVAALDDFRYTHLSMRIHGRQQRARVRIRGTGQEVPQDLDLTLNVGGLQSLADQALRLWPRARVHLATTTPSSP